MATDEEAQGGTHQRIDKWLFFTRAVKSRALAQALVDAGNVTINGQVATRSHHLVRRGDKVGVLLERRDLLLVVLDCGTRRGPFEVARRLYQDVSEPVSESRRLTPLERALRWPPTRSKDGT